MIRIFTTLAPWVIVGTIVIPPFIARMESADNWFRVSGITVPDVEHGQPIILSVSRTISRPFVGSWFSTVRSINPTGTEIVCAATGGTSYRTDAQLPKPTTLDWWTYPVKCQLPPGQYRLDTTWQFDVATGVTKTVTSESNIFRVK